MTSLPLNRREFLGTLAASGMALSLGKYAAAERITSGQAQSIRYAAEAAHLTQACNTLFWDGNSRMYRAPVLSSETVSSDALHDRGYTLWPTLIALQTLIEAEKHTPGSHKDQIAMVYDGLSQYFNENLQCYTAWVYFPGNNDAYYDDNSWVVIALVEASLACRKTDPQRVAQYLNRAQTVMDNFLVKGYDNSENPGGMRWGYDPAKPNTSDRGTSSTAGSALAALMLAHAGVNAQYYTQWGLSVLTWLTSRLQDSDDLIMDALEGPNFRVRRTKWTYNTGVPMRAYAEHYRLTKSKESLASAVKLARAALNPNGAMFDQTVNDPGKRFFWDSSYFVHYLVDGLIQVAEVTTDVQLSSDIYNVIASNVNYAQTYLRDPADGFYWRNWRLYTIGDAQLDIWRSWTAQTIQPEFDASERSQEKRFQTLPVKDRPLVKTLLANAGAARLLWLASKIPPTRFKKVQGEI